MSGCRLRMPEETAEFIRRLHPAIKQKVRAALSAVLADPACGKRLRNGLEGLRSYRIGRLRLIYRTRVPEEVEVVAIGPRRYVYEDTYRRLRSAADGERPPEQLG